MWLPGRFICCRFKELLISLRSEDDDEVDAMDEVAWLPVWAILQGLYGLPLLPDLQEKTLNPFMFHQYIKQLVVHTCEVS